MILVTCASLCKRPTARLKAEMLVGFGGPTVTLLAVVNRLYNLFSALIVPRVSLGKLTPLRLVKSLLTKLLTLLW